MCYDEYYSYYANQKREAAKKELEKKAEQNKKQEIKVDIPVPADSEVRS